MNIRLVTAVGLVAAAASITAPISVMADQRIHCESKQYQYHLCRIDTHGYVRLDRQTSKSNCRQGRSWDYDPRGIWVDDGCAGDFVVENRSRHYYDNHDDWNGNDDDHDAAKVAAGVAAIALIAAAASAANNDHDDVGRYRDDEYQHSGNNSYVPRWMRGKWEGFNPRFHSTIEMDIRENGRAYMRVNGTRINGYVNGERLFVGDAQFDIERAGNGFNTVERGDRSNVVHYRNVD